MRIFSFVFLIPLLMPVCAPAQSTGSIRGTMTDDSGAVIPAATVTITGNGASRTVQTQADGTYAGQGLAPGSYRVRVSFPGFAAFDKQVTVTAGSSVTLPIQMKVSAEKQEVTVSAENQAALSVEPDNNATALVLRGEDLAALPDDPDDLADALQALAGPGAGPNGGSIYIDGFSGGQLPPKESIREIRINQNPFSAEYDRLGFGRIEILTKPGTDRVRGSLYFNASNAVFNSRNPFASNKPDYSNRNFGGNIGGPINKRSSFFLDVQRRDIQDNAITNAYLVDPNTFAVTHLTNALVTPIANTTISPRVDYQLSTNHTLVVRMEERFNTRDNQGLGRNVLPPPYNNDAAYNVTGNAQNLMVTETAILNSRVVNETRFQFTRNVTQSMGNLIPSINVAGEFTTGGNGIGNRYDLGKHFELQNSTSILRGTHTIRFGVRVRRESDQSRNPQGFNGQFTFSGGALPQLDSNNQMVLDAAGNPVLTHLTSLDQYIRNLQLAKAGFTEAQIQQLGGGPTRFTIQAGQPYVSLVRWDGAPFVLDDWRVKPNFTLSAGLRYEVQNLAGGYRDLAPRIGFAWAPGSAGNGRQKTVIRGGFGIFYDRLGLAPFESALLNNGVSRLEFNVANPVFYPNIPPVSTLNAGQNTINLVDGNLRAEYSLQGAIGVERQLPRNSTVSVTYTANRSNHLAQTVPVNAPLPGTFNPLLAPGPGNGVFPYGFSAGNIFAYESGGILRQNILMVSFNTRFNRRVSLQGNYQYARANDLPATPTNPYDFALDWGRSNLDRRHNFTTIGSIQGPLGLLFAPFITLRSGAPYDVLLGQDVFGDTYFNARAAFAPPGAACGVNGVVCTSLGNFSTSYNVADPSNLVPRNYLTMAGLVSVNLRVQKVFGFGESRGGRAAGPSGGDVHAHGGGFGGGEGGARGGGGGMRMGPMGGGHGAFGGGGSSDHRYNLALSINFTNILNHTNPGGYQGVLTSNQFGQPTTVNTGFGGGFGGGLGGGMANNRRIELSLRFTF